MSFDPHTCREVLRKLLLSSDKPPGSSPVDSGPRGHCSQDSWLISYCHRCPGIFRGRGSSNPQPLLPRGTAETQLECLKRMTKALGTTKGKQNNMNTENVAHRVQSLSWSSSVPSLHVRCQEKWSPLYSLLFPSWVSIYSFVHPFIQ